MRKVFKFMWFTFLGNILNLGFFTHASDPHSNLQADIFENLFHPTAEMSGENCDFFYQNSIREYEDTWNIRLFILCMTCSSSKCYGFTVF